MDRRSFLTLSPFAVGALQAGCQPRRGARATRSGPATAGTTVRHAYCRLCTCNCGLELWLRGDELVSVRGDRKSFTKGFCCPTGASILEVMRDPRRLRSPLRRHGDGFTAVSWKAALDEIAERLTKIKGQHGARSLLMQTGYVFVRNPLVEQMVGFCHAFGSPNFSSVESICESAKRLAETLTYGQGTYADFTNAEVMVLWGANPFTTLAVYFDLIAQAQRRGARLVVIDPYRTQAAESSDLFLQVRPGSDGWLAAWLGKAALDRWEPGDPELAHLVGHAELKAALAGLTLETVAARCELTPQQVQQATTFLVPPRGTRRRVCYQLGLGLESHARGIQTMRAVAAVIALTQNLNVKGGNRFWGPRSPYAHATIGRPETPPIGYDEHPLFYMLTGKAQNVLLPQAVLEGKPYPIKAVVSFGSNFLKTYPDSDTYLRAVKALDLFVAVDPFVTETSRHADFILPPALFPERDDLLQMAGRLFYRPRVVAPPAGVLADAEIVVELARRLGLSSFTTATTGVQLLDQAAREYGLPLARLEHQGKWGARIPPRRKRQPTSSAGTAAAASQRSRGTFNTPSGQIELYSEGLKNLGHGPLPLPPLADGPSTAPTGATDYPLLLVTGVKRVAIINSSFEHLPIHTIDSRLTAQVHPDTAKAQGVAGHQEVDVQSPHGKVRARLQVTDRVKPGVVYVLSFFHRARLNTLLGYQERDPISGFPSFRGLRCTLTAR